MSLRAVRAAMLGGAALLALAGPVSADEIVVDAGWYGFCLDGAGAGAVAGCQNDGIGEAGNTFTFTATAPVYLQLTDAFLIGDVLKLVLDGTDHLSSAPGAGAMFVNPDAAFASGYYSRLSLALDPGSYSFDIFGETMPFGGGGAYVRVATQVPEPMSLALLGVGMLGLAGVCWRPAKGQAAA